MAETQEVKSSEVIILGLTELAKIALQMYFTQMAMAGQTAEQIAAMFATAKQEFEQRNPDLLKKV